MHANKSFIIIIIIIIIIVIHSFILITTIIIVIVLVIVILYQNICMTFVLIKNNGKNPSVMLYDRMSEFPFEPVMWW